MVDLFESAPRIQRSGTLRVELPFEQAFPLFTAEGETRWVPGWAPRILAQAETPGTVFLTGEGEEFTIWTVLERHPQVGRVSYSRVTPASRAGIVRVAVKREGSGCRVTVDYDLTAITPKGAASLAAYDEDSFSEMMKEWASLIAGAVPAS